MNLLKLLSLFVILHIVTACGGGGSSNEKPQNTPEPSLTIFSSSISEGNSGTSQIVFNVRLSDGPGSSVTVPWQTSDNTALAGEDYEASSGTITFSGSGTEVQKISVTVYGDTKYSDNEGTETFNVSISHNTIPISNSTATGTISNDDLSKAEAFEQLAGIVLKHRYDVRDQIGGDISFKHIEIDVNNDGDKDLITLNSSIIPDPTETFIAEPNEMVYYVNNRGAGYERIDTDIKVFSRFEEVADVNGDGLDDLITVVDHIIQDTGERVNPVRLILQTDDGFVDASNQVDEVLADWHGLEAIDVELDGDIDFIASGLHDGLHLFINDGAGNFTENFDMIPTINQYPFFVSIGSADLNNDGYSDLFIGTNESFSTDGDALVLMNGNLSGSIEFSIEEYLAFSSNNNYNEGINDVKEIDYNQDGCADIITLNTNPEHRNITLLEGNCTGSLTIVESFEFGDVGFYWMEVKDVNQDSISDIYLHQKKDIDKEDVILLIGNGSGFDRTNYNENDHTLDFVTRLSIAI